MPEAAVDEYYFPVFGENDIRGPGKVSSIQSEPEAHPMNDGADYLFGFRVSTLDPPHYPASLLWREYIVHFALVWAIDRRTYTTSAIRAASSGGTAFPICLAISIFVPLKMKSSGKL